MGASRLSVLVTGGCGFLGVHVLKRLSEEGYSVVSYDINDAQPRPRGPGRVSFVKGDVADLHRLLEAAKKFKVERAVHLAALLTAESEENPPRAFKVNVDGTINVLEAARLMDFEGVVYASSQAVYGVTGGEPVREDHPKNPVSVYGATKLASELAGFKYAELYSLGFAALRFPMIYGPGPRGRGARLINMIVEPAARGERAVVPFSGDMKVEPLHVADAAESVLSALKVRVTGAYNIGTGEVHTLRGVLNILKELRPEADAIFKANPGRLVYPVQGPLSIEKARAELSFAPRHNLRSGLRSYLEHLKAEGGASAELDF
ncbi:MAG: NAD(P)-dependent oxidoreductase [Desulfurococcaceae archaeon]